MVGLRRLGFDVAFVEQGAEILSAEREHFERVCAQFDIDGYLLTGPPPYELVARAEAATLLLDIGGHLTRPELKRGTRVKVYLDDDPGYTQLWHRDGLRPGRLDGYDFHYTFGEKWNAQSLAFNLIKRLEKYILQPRQASPLRWWSRSRHGPVATAPSPCRSRQHA